MYGGSAPKLESMLSLSSDEAKKLYDDYWDSVLPLKLFRDNVEKFCESTGNDYVIALDSRRLKSRSKHSLVNLLFQSGGSLVMKWSVLRYAQAFEELGIWGNILEDTVDEIPNKVYNMIVYHKQSCGFVE